jgi:hypothetical protein
MKATLVIIALAVMALTIRAEGDSASPTTAGASSKFEWDPVTPAPQVTAPSPNKSLIRSGRYGTIRYFNGPAFSLPELGSAGLDMNADGASDFLFAGEGLITGSLPGGNLWLFDLQGIDSNQFLAISNLVTVWSYGAPISDRNFPGGFFFGNPWDWISDRANVATFYSGTDSFWAGPLALPGIGYIGVRFQAADGLHYGWVRVHLPTTVPMGISNGQPMVMDWAYEKRTNTPIRAGAISSARGVKEFTIFLQSTNLFRPLFGHAFLMGNVLRYEMHFPGTFSNATFFADPMSMGPLSRLLAPVRVDSPRINTHLSCPSDENTNGIPPGAVCETEITVFFGDIKLNSLQLELLRREQLEVDIGNGAAIGDFVDERLVELQVPRVIPRGTNLPPIPLPTPLPGTYPVPPPVRPTNIFVPIIAPPIPPAVIVPPSGGSSGSELQLIGGSGFSSGAGEVRLNPLKPIPRPPPIQPSENP